MEKVVLDGKVFVKAASAADELGYTRDYIGQLCRAGKVEAHLVGRSWYVNQEQLRVHKKEKKRSSRVKAREQVRSALAKKQDSNEKTYVSRITYESDEEELIPAVKKLNVNEDRPSSKEKDSDTKKKKKEKKKKEPNYTFENKGEKVVMSGSLDVTDASEEDEWFDESATTFKTRVVKGKPEEMKKKSRSTKQTKDISSKAKDKDSESEGSQNAEQEGESSFEQKLAIQDAAEESDANTQSVEAKTEKKRAAPARRQQGKRPSVTFMWFLAFVIVYTLISATGMALESTWSVIAQDNDTDAKMITTRYTIDLEEVAQFLKSHILP